MEILKRTMLPEYTRTAPLKTIEDQVKSGEKTAMEIYRENISDRSIPDIQQGVLNARNVTNGIISGKAITAVKSGNKVTS
jgi:hypothetical protein